jgi:DNA-binding cell septation regulator SpoVG
MEVRIKKFYPFLLKMKKATLLGYADIILDNLLEIRGIKLLKKPNGGIFIAPPSIQNDRGDYVEFVHFLDRHLKEKIRKTLSDYYKKHFEREE